MADDEVVNCYYYYPLGVQRILASGTSAFIGEVGGSTVLKYPLEPGGDMSRLEHEHKILKILGFTNDGLYLEYAINGTIHNYLTEPAHTPTLQQRVAWCREVAEAVEYVHSKGVIHCDIQPTNILVNGNLHLKLADFQGNYLLEGGEVAGWSAEPYRYWCPRENEFEANFKTDLFAFGSTICFIMTGHEVFPDIIDGEDGWQEKVKSRFASGIFLSYPHVCDTISRKCWECQYSTAREALKDIEAVERRLVRDQGH